MESSRLDLHEVLALAAEFVIIVSSLNDDLKLSTEVGIVGKLASVSGYGEDCASALRGSGGRILFAECDPFRALQAYFEGVTARSLETLDSFDNEVDLACSKGLDGTEVDHTKPQKIVIVSSVGHGASRFADVAFQEFFRTFPRFQKSVESGRQCGVDPPGGNFHAERSSNGSCRSRRALQLMDAGGL